MIVLWWETYRYEKTKSMPSTNLLRDVMKGEKKPGMKTTTEMTAWWIGLLDGLILDVGFAWLVEGDIQSLIHTQRV